MIKLNEFVNKLNSITDPSRSKFEREFKGNHKIVVTGYPDPWIDVINAGDGIVKTKRLADVQPGEDEDIYSDMNEAFVAGKLTLGDKSNFTLTTEDAALLNSVFLSSGTSKQSQEKIAEGLKKSKKKMQDAIAFAKTVK